MIDTGASDTIVAFIARWEPSGGKELANWSIPECNFRMDSLTPWWSKQVDRYKTEASK